MKKAKILCMLLALMMIISVFAGCNNGGKSGYEMQTEPGEGTKITKDPLELTIFLHRGALGAFDYDEMSMFQAAFDKTNIKLTGTASKNNTDANQEFNVMLTSAVLPDIVQGSKANLNKSGVEGAFIPLQDLIDEYAPNIKKVLDEHPDYMVGSMASDGNLYYIPALYEGTSSED